MRGRANVVVVSDGVGVDALREFKQRDCLDNLLILPLQPYDRLSEVMGAADVLVAVIDADAGRFSVPSKVQSYLCARRPIILSAPVENHAATVVAREDAGIVVDPGAPNAAVAAAERLYADPTLRAQLADNGRRYAERAYDLHAVADKFERVFEAACGRRAVTGR